MNPHYLWLTEKFSSIVNYDSDIVLRSICNAAESLQEANSQFYQLYNLLRCICNAAEPLQEANSQYYQLYKPEAGIASKIIETTTITAIKPAIHFNQTLKGICAIANTPIVIPEVGMIRLKSPSPNW